MIYDYKQVKGGDLKKHQMKRSLQQALFDRETNFEELPNRHSICYIYIKGDI